MTIIRKTMYFITDNWSLHWLINEGFRAFNAFFFFNNWCNNNWLIKLLRLSISYSWNHINILNSWIFRNRNNSRLFIWRNNILWSIIIGIISYDWNYFVLRRCHNRNEILIWNRLSRHYWNKLRVILWNRIIKNWNGVDLRLRNQDLIYMRGYLRILINWGIVWNYWNHYGCMILLRNILCLGNSNFYNYVFRLRILNWNIFRYVFNWYVYNWYVFNRIFLRFLF